MIFLLGCSIIVFWGTWCWQYKPNQTKLELLNGPFLWYLMAVKPTEALVCNYPGKRVSLVSRLIQSGVWPNSPWQHQALNFRPISFSLPPPPPHLGEVVSKRRLLLLSRAKVWPSSKSTNFTELLSGPSHRTADSRSLKWFFMKWILAKTQQRHFHDSPICARAAIMFLPHIELDLPSNWVWQQGNNRINTRSCAMAWSRPKWNRTKKLAPPLFLWHFHDTTDCPTVCELVPRADDRGNDCLVWDCLPDIVRLCFYAEYCTEPGLAWLQAEFGKCWVE